jgi:geranylgeranyl pyrophosphate synthase
MIGGQELDLFYTKDLARYNSLTAKDILHIHTLKTAKFIELTFQITSLIANLSPKTNQHFTSFGSAVGIMFQILDDIEDYKQNTQSLNLLNILSKNDIKNYLTNLLNQSKYDIQESSITSSDLINLQESIYFSAISLLSK